MVKVTILYENHPHPSRPDLEFGHGFSALVEAEGKNILFDAGWNGSAVLRNCGRLGVPLQKIDGIFLSHAHWDHIGGMPQVLELAENPGIYYPDIFSKIQPKEWAKLVTDPDFHRVKVFQPLENLSPNIASTGCLEVHKYLGEQAMVLRNENSDHGVLLVGCLHPGLSAFIDAVKSYCHITHVIGGFHGYNDVHYLRKTGIQALWLGHCTRYPEVFETIKDIHFSRLHVGMEILLPQS